MRFPSTSPRAKSIFALIAEGLVAGMSLVGCRASGIPTANPTPSADALAQAVSTLQERPTAPPSLLTNTPSPTVMATATWVGGGWCRGATPMPSAGTAAPTPVVLEWTVDDGTWRWREGDAAPSKLPPSAAELAAGPCPEKDCASSSDGRYRAWFREATDRQYEVVVQPLDAGQPSDALAVATVFSQPLWDEAAPYLAEGGSMKVGTDLDWLEGPAHRLMYRLEPRYDAISEDPYEAVGIYDADTGQAYPLFPAGEVWSIRWPASGNPLVAVTNDEVRLIDTADGRLRARIAAEPDPQVCGGVRLSPDSSRALVFVRDGLMAVDLATGDSRHIALKYESLGRGHCGVPPEMVWRDGRRPLLLVDPTGDEKTTEVWQLDLDAGTAERLHTLVGSYAEGTVSPDGHFLGSYASAPGLFPHREVYLSDLETGQQAKYAEGPGLICCEWSPAGNAFLYQESGAGGNEHAERFDGAYLGHVCRPPVRLPEHGNYFHLSWLDDQHFVAVLRPPECQGCRREEGWEIRLMSLSGQDEPVARVAQNDPPWPRLSR